MKKSALLAIICTSLLMIPGMRYAYGQGISGPDYVTVTNIEQYQYYDDVILTNPVWTVTGGTIGSQWQSGSIYYCEVYWAEEGSQTLSFFNGSAPYGEYNVQVNPCAVSTPSTAFTYTSNSTSAVVTRSSNPPGDAQWFWQNYPQGASTTIGSSSSVNVPAGKTYFVRARMTGSQCWSANSVATAIIPGNTTVYHGSGCRTGSTTSVALSATPGTNANTIRWYSAASGGSPLATATNYNTPQISSTTTYYACSYNSTTGAHGVRIPVIANVYTATVGGSLNISNTELSTFSGTITVTGQTGAVVRWELNSGSGWQVLSSTSANIYFYKPDYTSAQYRAVIKNGSCNEANSTAMKVERYGISPGNTVLLTALTGANYQWHKNGVAILGATQSTYTANDIALYSVRTNSVTTGVFYIRDAFHAQAFPVNAVRSSAIMKLGIGPNTNLTTLLPNEIAQVINYQDGLGRTFQTVAVNQAPTSKDIVAAVGLGRLGMVDTTYLPYVASTNDGRFKQYALKGANNQYTASEQYQFYQGTAKVATDNYPFARTLYRNTPDAKVTEQGAPGADWQPGAGHMVKNITTWNGTTYPVRFWKPDGTTNTNYPNNSVAVSITTDENGYKVRTYTNTLGQTVLKQVQLDETLEGVSTPWLETYYIYDEYQRLKYTVPPKAMKVLGTGTSLDANASSVNELIYKYTYDERNRLIIKKEPGANEQHFVYDLHDRVVFTQDGNLRTQSPTPLWTFLKYDRFNRVVYSGIYTRNVTRATLQGEMNARNYNTEPYFDVEQANATYHGYSNQVHPTTNLTVLAVTYYDHYDFDRNGAADFSYANNHLTGQEASASTRTRGMTTGSKRVTINEAGSVTSTWLVNAVFFDAYDRPIQTQSNNHLYTTVADKGTVIYDFAGKAIKTKSTHYQNASTSVSLTDWNDYDHAGRVLKTYRQINNESPVTVAQYEYNALGQMVVKKLHDLGTNNWLQTVDYEFTIRGWVKKINDPANLGSDYYAQELIYNTTVAGLSNTLYYNGNISAIKWKGPAQANGAEDQRSYKYTYDKSDRLKTAAFQAHNSSAWNKEENTLNESVTYDHNGNIKTLERNHNLRGLSGTTVTSTAQTVDNLTYTYASNRNRLTKVEDAVSATIGIGDFKNGVAIAKEYSYDSTGSLAQDLNKGIQSIVYNMLGKPRIITFSDGRKIEYTYSASGTKLTMKTFQGATLLTNTNYSGGFVYEGATPVLSFFNSPEGRVVKNGSTYEYQYAIADHQGNTRVVFTSAAPAPVVKTATFEGNSGDDSGEFVNVSNIVTSTASNNTPGGSKVVRMNQSYRVGPGKSVKVFPGDVINAEVWAYYESGSGYGTTSPALSVIVNAVAAAFGGVSGGAGESGMIYNGVNAGYGGFGMGGNQGDAVPAAYLNYILFDKNYKVLNMGWRPVTTASSWAKAKLSFDPINIKEAGYIFVYLSYENESNNWVYFDDFKVTHTKSRIVQYNEYYPFGLQTANSWTRENTTGNNFLANGGTELNQTSQLYDLDFRNYDPILGRMNGVDPMASKYSSLTPYNYSFNDPVSFNDPSGADPYDHYSGGSGYYYSGGYYTYDDVARNPDNMGEFHSAFGWRDSYSMGFLASALGYGGVSSWQANTFGGIALPTGASWKQIMNGITEALTSKDKGIWNVNPRTGAATLHTSEQQLRDRIEELDKKISSQSGPVSASTNEGPSGASPWDIVKGNSKLLLRMILHLPDAFSINGNINAIQLLGVDWTPDSRFLSGKKVSFLGMLTGPDRGKSKNFYEHPLAIGFDISAGITLGEYFYVPNGNQPFRLDNFQGERLSVSVGFGFFGFDGSVGFVYAPLESGYYIGIMRFVGAGDPGLSINVNWGRTFFDD
ncbi:MAG TPA: DUF6443 domain-containing protein [Cyclobacteriaceae bacterium]|nr:DUF6443 domain-containing protein [Cyclobacteriaceae bacterium]HRJ81740.1 DUF6443 domain-containing protein [Cyclobacteriaceae bacterium]